MIYKKIIYCSLGILFFGTGYGKGYAQEARRDITGGLEYSTEMQATASDGRSPLWLNANRYGLSSLEKHNGFVRVGLTRPLAADSLRKWGMGYGLDVAVAHNFTSDFIVQQAFVEARWMKGVLTVGSKEMPMEMKDRELSSGSQTLGINARPIPQVRLALPEYWTIPYTKGFVAIKGHVAYGWMTDGGWQKSFVPENGKYQQHVLYHSKAGYIRIGDENRHPLTVEGGLEMATIFGGSVYSGGKEFKQESGLKNYIKALIPLNGNNDKTLYSSEGNQLGSVLLSIGYKFPTWKVRAYMDHYFEDGSSMYMLDYDGYGSGTDWNKHTKSRYVLYDPKDGMYGVEITLPKNRWVSRIVAEHLYTKYQSGPIYHDHSQYISDHIGGRDGYYNHGTYTGWQHWGQVIGNPLYMSPLYNDDHSLTIKDNRFTAWHFGLNGDPAGNIHYRLLLTMQKGWGTYDTPYSDVKRNTSLMAEVRYDWSRGWSVKGAAALDHGALLGNNTGVQFTIMKCGILNGGK